MGNYTVGKSLTLEGQPTTAMPTPTLDGDETGSVVRIRAGTVRFKKLTIQNGYAKDGGGIYSAAGYDAAGVYYPGGKVVLNTTTVRGNIAAGGGQWASNNGGGIYIGSDASLTLNVGSRVVHNVAISQDEAYGGGIYSDYGRVTLNANALVADNFTNGVGGGIAGAEGNIHLKGTSSVRRNVGGGIYSDVGVITMSDSSLVASNEDGGVYGWDSLLLSGSASVVNNTGGGVNIDTEACDASSPSPWVGAISPNTPDDVPPVTYIHC